MTAPPPEPPPAARPGQPPATRAGADDGGARGFAAAPLSLRLMVGALVVFAVAAVWVSNLLLTDRFTETTRNRAELRLVLYAGNVLSEVQRNAAVPLLLARDPEMIRALQGGEYMTTSHRLISFQSEIAAAAIQLLDADGRVVGATDRNRLGETLRSAPFFVEATRQNETVFTATQRDSGGYDFVFSRAVRAEGTMLGVVAVAVDLSKFERSWAGFLDAVLVTDSSGQIILSTEPRWRGRTVAEALAVRAPTSAIRRAIEVTADWAQPPPDARLRGEAVMRTEARIPFRGWRIVSFTRYDSVRERVWGVLALEIMGFAILLALTFYLVSRRAWSRSALFQRESEELRALNRRLQREIAERERAQESLAVAEQTLVQSSKLAVLGEMSAAVSHELNQPLAAMKTYLAGARLLLRRRRPEEALSAFQRIDDLIDRMGAITRQLKSYARKGGEAFAPLDLRSAVSEALAMMEPQLKTLHIGVSRTLPREPVRVLGDRIRIEQVIVNLLRNAVDATRGTPEPQIEIVLTADTEATLAVRDNGHGIGDLDSLFEPFYTTKKAGDGVGLGLAISSGIVSEHGGRLTARNAPAGGAVFVMQLPLMADAPARAAE